MKKNKATKNGGVKMLMTKRHIQTRSSDQHRLLLLTEVQTKEYRVFRVHGKIYTALKLANKSLLQLYVFCLSKKKREKKFS